MFSTALSLLGVLLLTITPQYAIALPQSVLDPRASSTCGYTVNGVGKFMKFAQYTFTGPTLPDGLYPAKDEPVTDHPYTHHFIESNVILKDGFLNLKVPGGQNPAATHEVTGGEVFTTEQHILYASVRTHAILSSEPGTCQGLFFYKTDNQEADIEYLSDPRVSDNPGGKPAIHYTNHPIHGGDSTTAIGGVPTDFDKVVHEYRLDWTKDATSFYIDGKLQRKFTVNVPTEPGSWLWNNWANGDKIWAGGPPVHDSILKIKSIEMYYNTTSTAGGC